MITGKVNVLSEKTNNNDSKISLFIEFIKRIVVCIRANWLADKLQAISLCDFLQAK